MEDVLSKFSTNQPESYLILAALLYAIKKFFPLFKSHLEQQGAILGSLLRIEKNTQDNLTETREVKAISQSLTTKDDMIDVLLNGVQKRPMDSVAKQESVSGAI